MDASAEARAVWSTVAQPERLVALEKSRAVSAMRIYLDTGVIAGAVDDALGIQMLLAGRTGG